MSQGRETRKERNRKFIRGKKNTIKYCTTTESLDFAHFLTYQHLGTLTMCIPKLLNEVWYAVLSVTLYFCPEMKKST